MIFQRCDGTTHYYDRQADVDALAIELDAVPRVALDTEADSLHHYHEKVCLIQLSFCGKHVLVDPLAHIELRPLLEVLASRELVVHGADYDLRMLHRCYGFVPSKVFDTMLAAHLLGYKQLGLASLAERFCGVHLSKHGQKADWSRRPLTGELIQYATNDTRHLLCIADRLADELRQKGRLAWHEEECRRLISAAVSGAEESQTRDDWRVKGWHTLPEGRARAILRELWQWREKEAELADVPPFKIARADVLVELARWATENNTIEGFPNLPKNIRGKRLARMKQVVANGLTLPKSQWPQHEPLRSGRCKACDKTLLAKLRRVRDEIAAKLGLEPSVICSSGVLTTIGETKPETLTELGEVTSMSHWQLQLLGTAFLSVLAEHAEEISNAPLATSGEFG
ncbi:MAG: HRDC domain-containing protein [Candidatus Sumerlaeaceae bacterium]|nr:HRDC domain-containing protein [Candidatus Sumerlaeaceae bacterium]